MAFARSLLILMLNLLVSLEDFSVVPPSLCTVTFGLVPRVTYLVRRLRRGGVLKFSLARCLHC
jgi:hypothetical protein